MHRIYDFAAVKLEFVSNISEGWEKNILFHQLNAFLSMD